jgi:hypothetical protein
MEQLPQSGQNVNPCPFRIYLDKIDSRPKLFAHRLYEPAGSGRFTGNGVIPIRGSARLHLGPEHKKLE